jgi:hypothetical protein
MLWHDHVAKHIKAHAPAHLLEDAQEQVTTPRANPARAHADNN